VPKAPGGLEVRTRDSLLHCSSMHISHCPGSSVYSKIRSFHLL